MNPMNPKQEKRDEWMGQLHRNHIQQVARWRHQVLAVQLSMLVCMFLLWEVAGRLRWIDVLLFSYPSKIFAQIGKDIASGELWAHVGVTVGRRQLVFTGNTRWNLACGFNLVVSFFVQSA